MEPPDTARWKQVRHDEIGRTANRDARLYKFAAPIEIAIRAYVEAVSPPSCAIPRSREEENAPGLSTRRISRSAASGSGMCSSTQSVQIASNELSGNGIAVAEATTKGL
jgi:hypothetical protein